MPGEFFSYAACNDFNPVSPCAWAEVAKQNDPCKCNSVAVNFVKNLLIGDMEQFLQPHDHQLSGIWEL